jgi:3D domain
MSPLPLGLSATGVALLAAASLGLPAVAHAGAVACPRPVAPPPEQRIIRPRWLSNVLITEYFPAPERWFAGRLVRAPGLPGRHRIDWLYSSRGLAMQGEGVGSDGRLYHFAGPYSLTWRNSLGEPTLPCTHAPGYWDNGRPAWIGPRRLARFARGPSLTLSYWHDVAVDPRLIARGSSIFAPAYCGTPSRGWFTAADTGGAIIGAHIDVFRAPPAKAWDFRTLRGQKVFVVPPGFARPARLHC